MPSNALRLAIFY